MVSFVTSAAIFVGASPGIDVHGLGGANLRESLSSHIAAFTRGPRQARVAAYDLRTAPASRALRIEARNPMNRRIRQALVSFDERVQERFSDVFSSSQGISPWGDRVGDLGGALMSALKHQSIENGPLLVFAAGGAVLFLFMVRT